ncbi:MAG: alpha/beta fold hydrolase [Ignavibacteriales bacterium]|nr:alpha/beta fold hydrolase [Ignavibacteriales bacterium]
MKKIIAFLSLLWICTTNIQAQENIDSSGLNSLSAESFKAVAALFKYDRTIPLDVQIVERFETKVYIREKIVFTGVRGDRVPGYLALPKNGTTPNPVVLLFHIGAGSKDSWWDATSFERGPEFTDSLLEYGIAVLAIDAQFHGERSVNNDYLPIQQMYYDYKWFYRYRDGIIQTIGDCFRAIDYLSERKEIDVQRIGVLGHSIGGAMAIIYAALDQRVKSIVASVAAFSEPWLYPITPINLAGGVQAPTLILGGRNDIVISTDTIQRLYSVIGAEVKEIELYSSGHRLPEENINRSVNWLYKYLQK